MKKYALIKILGQPVLFSLKKTKDIVDKENFWATFYIKKVIKKSKFPANISFQIVKGIGMKTFVKFSDGTIGEYSIDFKNRFGDKLVEFESDDDAKLWFEMEYNL